MFKNIKNFMLMKKRLLLIIFLISSFLFVGSIKAQTNEVIIYDYESNKFQDLEDNYDLLEDVIDYINEHNTHNFSILISYKYDNGSTYLIVGVNQRVSNSNTHFRNYQRFYIGASNHLATYYYSSPGTYSTQNSYCYFDSGTSNCNTNTQLNLSNYTQSDLQTFYTNINSLLSSRQTNTNLSGGTLSLTFNNSPYSPFDLNNQNKFTSYVWSNKPIQIYRQNQDSVINMPFSIQIDDVDNDVPLWNSSNPPTPYILTDYKTWYDLRPHAPVITFTSQNYISNNDVYKKDVTIDFGTIDNDNYAYMYLNTNDNIWHTLYLTENTSYTFSVYENCNIIAQVIDKNTQEVFTSASYLVNDIVLDLDISILVGQNYNSFGVVTSLPVEILFFSNDRSRYRYEYTLGIYDNLDSSLSNFWIELDSDKTSISLTLYENTMIYARIIDITTGQVVYTKTTNADLSLQVPNINFLLFPQLTYETYIGDTGITYGRNCIYDDDIEINFGFLNNVKYVYQYSLDNGDSWVTLNFEDRPRIVINVISNGYIVARVLSQEDNHVVTQATFTINNIGTCNVDVDNNGSHSVTSAFTYWTSPIRDFLSILTYFWNGLPNVLHYFFIFIFILLVMLFALRFML